MRVLIFVLMVGGIFAQSPPPGLVGRWRTATPPTSGLGAIYEFQTGGVVKISPAAIAPGTYRIKGNEIILPPLQVGGTENAQTLDLSKPGRLRLLQGSTVSMDLTRVGQAPSGPPTVVGEWTGMQKSGGRMLQMKIFFYQNKASLFLLPVDTHQASYRIDKKIMFITMPDGKVVSGPFEIGQSLMSIPSVKAGKLTTLGRF